MQQSDENYINHEVRLQLLESTCNQILSKLDKMSDSFEKMQISVNQEIDKKIDAQNQKIDAHAKKMDSNFKWLLATVIVPVVLHWMRVI